MNDFDAKKYIDFIFVNDTFVLKSEKFGINTTCPLTLSLLNEYKRIQKDYAETLGGFSPILLTPTDIDKDGQQELNVSSWFKSVHRGGLAYVTMVYKYIDSKWQPISVNIEPEYKFEKDFSIGKFTLNMNQEKVVSLIGTQPNKKTPMTLTYNLGIKFYFNNNILKGIETTSPLFSTTKGFKIGDSIKRTEELYGYPSEADDSISYEYDIGKNVKLEVDFKNSKVVKLYMHEYEE
jgi:hypothetical protein